MKDSIRAKLESTRDRFEEVSGLLADPDVIADQDQFRNLSMEYSRLEPIMKLFEQYETLSGDVAAAEEMTADSDESVREMGQEELAGLGALGTGHADPDQADGLLLRAAGRTRDAGGGDAEVGAEALTEDEAGRLQSFRQLDWQVRLERYQTVSGTAGSRDLPTRVTAENERTRLRLVVSEWEI